MEPRWTLVETFVDGTGKGWGFRSRPRKSTPKRGYVKVGFTSLEEGLLFRTGHPDLEHTGCVVRVSCKDTWRSTGRESWQVLFLDEWDGESWVTGKCPPVVGTPTETSDHNRDRPNLRYPR